MSNLELMELIAGLLLIVSVFYNVFTFEDGYYGPSKKSIILFFVSITLFLCLFYLSEKIKQDNLHQSRQLKKATHNE